MNHTGLTFDLRCGISCKVADRGDLILAALLISTVRPGAGAHFVALRWCIHFPWLVVA